MSEITTVGIDLAKNILSVHGVDAGGKAVLRKSLARSKLIELMAQLPPCRVGLEDVLGRASARAHATDVRSRCTHHGAQVHRACPEPKEQRRQPPKRSARRSGSTQYALRAD